MSSAPRRDPARWSGGGAGSPTAWSRSGPLSRNRTRCPRCPAPRGTTRCRHRHDTGRSGWRVQVELVPLVGLIWLLVPRVGKNTTAPLQVIVHLPRARTLAAISAVDPPYADCTVVALDGCERQRDSIRQRCAQLVRMGRNGTARPRSRFMFRQARWSPESNGHRLVLDT
jgi:hypothetical protein